MDKYIQQFNSLIKKLSKGDRSALEKIYNDYSGLFFAMAKKYLYDKSLAEDLISEVFIKIVQYSRSFDDTQNGLNWVFKIIHNSALDMNKKESKHQSDNIDDHNNLSDIMQDPDNNIDADTLSLALKQLTDEENKIIYLLFWEGLTVREIGTKMNLPKSNIHYKMKIALKKMKKFLSNIGQY